MNLFKKFGFKLNFDHVFIHRDAADKLQWFENWLVARAEWKKNNR